MSSQQSNPKHTWGSQENEQVQQPNPSSTTQTSGSQGGANSPAPKGPKQPQNPLSLKQRFVKFVDRFSFVLVPLLFAILIFFFTLLIASHEHVFLPPLSLAMLLLALGVIQGTLLYYINNSKNQASKETYWNLTVIIGYALFLVFGTLAIFGFGASVLLLLLLLLVGVLVARRSIRQVPEGSIDIVKMFGKYVRTLQPGPHLIMPWEKIGDRLNTKETPWKSPSLGVKIAQDYEVQLVATIWYQLDSENAHIADLHVMNWETSLQEKFVSTLKNVFREVTPAEIKSWQQGTTAQPSGAINATGSTTGTTLEHITNSIATLVKQEVDNWGVKIRKVDIQDLTLIPNLAPRGNPIVRQVSASQMGAGPAGVQQEPVTINQAVDQQTTTPVQPPYASGYPLNSASQIEMLKGAFEAVRIGRLKDPQTIRDIAAQFEAHMYDPNLDFYPLRAAEILYSRARLYEEQNNPKDRAPETVTVEKDHTNVIVKEEKGHTSVTVDEGKGRTSVTVQFVVQPDI